MTAVVPSFLADPHHVGGDDAVHVTKYDGEPLLTEPFFSCCCLVAKLCPTRWDTMNCSLPGSSVQGIAQAGILEWVAIPFSRGSSQLRD